MAEDEDRKVEAQGGIVGSGMLTDPERIRQLEAEKARRERAWRNKPEKGFGEILSEKPAKKFERVGVYTPADERLDAAAGPDAESESGSASADEASEDSGTDSDSDAPQAPAEVSGLLPQEPPPPAPRLPPDPRMAQLNRMLDEKSAKKTKKRRRRAK